MNRRISSVVVLLLVLAGGTWGVRHFWKVGRPSMESSESADAAVVDADVVVLSRQKQEAALITSKPAEVREFRSQMVVPGRLQYDDTRHVEIKSAVAGIIIEMRVKPGDRVEAGETLAVASSPEIGDARANLLKVKAEYELAQHRLNWANETHQGIAEVLSGIKEHKSVDEIRKATEAKNLGDYRDKIITAYSRLRLASQLKAKLDGLNEGALSGRAVLERITEQESAQAALDGVMEQARYDSQMKFREADVAASDSRRRFELAEQHVRSLIGLNSAEDSTAPSDAGDRLAHIEIRAPFAGTIEKRTFAASERIAIGDPLFVLADSSRLWVAADVREREWGVLGLAPESAIKVTVPALPGECFEANLDFVGREVSSQTNALPLMARIDNSSGRLRPGLFVRVELPFGNPRNATAVPEAAVMEHEGQTFVFVDEGEGRFRRVPIATGHASDGWIEVRSGVNAGTNVVSRGTFVLKSELFLKGEAD